MRGSTLSKKEIDHLRAVLEHAAQGGASPGALDKEKKGKRRKRRRRPRYTVAGNAIMRARLTRNWTQGKLAEKMGTYQSNVTRLETGRVQASMKTLERVAAATRMRLVIDFVEPLAPAEEREERLSDYD